MISDYGKRSPMRKAPLWAEATAPKNLLRRNIPSLLLISMPAEDYWVVASDQETDAIANPSSALGQLLRSHCALLSLPYYSNN